MTYKILKGNSLDLLPTLADNSIDAIVTDPPYELGFMGKTWDNSGIAYSLELWQQCLRVLKPGGHLLAFSGSRTYHRMVVSIEDAGFEIRDMISWISNKTFPKSQNIAKAIDKQAGARGHVAKGFLVAGEYNNRQLQGPDTTYQDPALVTPEAKKWDGWGTGLKPTVEPIVMARKPVEGTVANNVLTYGTGGLNIDASRIVADDQEKLEKNWDRNQSIAAQEGRNSMSGGLNGIDLSGYKAEGRWPANLILDEYTAELLDEQSGQSKSPKTYVRGVGTLEGERVAYANIGEVAGTESQNYGDSGGASRFFYVAKASKRDRNEGLEDLDESVVGSYAGNVANKGNKIGADPDKPNEPAKNFHPTVKPTALMQYLVKLVTPPGGTVLDPFTGSGSTGKAAILEGFDFMGIELTEDYWPIIEGRLKHAEAKVAEAKENQEAQPEGLF
jgi:site-specific DNA-methyltransferase (adenine-specific)